MEQFLVKVQRPLQVTAYQTPGIKPFLMLPPFFPWLWASVPCTIVKVSLQQLRKPAAGPSAARSTAIAVSSN